MSLLLACSIIGHASEFTAFIRLEPFPSTNRRPSFRNEVMDRAREHHSISRLPIERDVMCTSAPGSSHHSSSSPEQSLAKTTDSIKES